MRKQAHGAEVQKHLAVVARYAIGREKIAELGGSGNDIPFEQAFSNLAHAYLREKAPTLLDHELGFQLLDRNQENTKAIGVFGFNVGSALLYAPVFFLNGNLKGHELLYLKNQDQFVPLKENWLNDILNRKPNILGKGVTRNSGQLGMQPPDFNRLVHSPASKYGSANLTMKQAMDGMLPKFAKMATDNLETLVGDLGEAMNLPRFLKEAGLQMIERLVTTCKEFPELAVKLDEFHGLKVVEEAIKTAGARMQKQAAERAARRGRSTPTTGPLSFHEHPLQAGTLKFATFDDTVKTSPGFELSAEEREQVLADRLLIKDARADDDVSIPYHVQVEQRLQNPQETGLYDVLVRPDKFEKCLIVLNPTGADGTTDFVTLVRVGDGDGGANWLNTPSNKVWTSHQYTKEEFNKWWEGLRKPESLAKSDNRYLLLGPGGTGTLPFRVEREYIGGDESSVYEVDFDDYCNRAKRHGLRHGSYEDTLSYDRWRDGQRIHLGGKQGTKIRSSRGDVYVPEDYRLVTCRQTAADKETNECGPCVPYSQGSSDAPPIRPGDLADVELNLTMPKFGPPSDDTKKEAAEITLATPQQAKRAALAQLRPLELALTAGRYLVNGREFNKRAALLHLVCDHGFRQETAETLLDKANCPQTYVCHVKYAYGYQPMGGGPGASPYLRDSGPTVPPPSEPPMSSGSFLHDSVPTQYQYTEALPIPELSASLTDPQIYNPNPRYDRPIVPPEVERIMQAAQTGQREVFDTAMIGTMLKAVRDDTMVDRYLGDLQKGLDRLGRILFMFYWHGDSFAERYGKQDLPELEDSLRNAFEMVGDVILFLKQKTIQPYPEEDGNDIDLQPIANS